MQWLKAELAVSASKNAIFIQKKISELSEEGAQQPPQTPLSVALGFCFPTPQREKV